MNFERGELVLVPFPFSDLTAAKRRPVLALTSPDDFGDFVGLPVTSRAHHLHVVPISSEEVTGGSLPRSSWIRTDRVVTLNRSLVIKPVARVARETVETAILQLCAYLGRRA